MESSLSASTQADHLCVLVHGLWGNPTHLKYLASSLRERHSEHRLHILVAKSNAGSFTYDGIELGGERVTHEIEETLEQLAKDGREVRKLSVVGYSLGGLVARYAVGLLFSKGWFDKLEPVNFTTFATPHLGVRTPLLGYHNHIWNVLGARTLSASGRQLFTIDKFRDTGRPLLAVLADPSSIFIKALARFQHRSLYANIVNDRSAVYYTTAISATDPFVDLKAIKINYAKGYEPVILEPDMPVSPKNQEEPPALYQRLAGTGRSVLTKIPLVALLVVLVPIGSVAFLVSSGIQSIRSTQRIRLHEEGKAGIGPGSYRIPLMIEDIRREAEEVFGSINHSQDQEYLVTSTEGSDTDDREAETSSRKQSNGSVTVHQLQRTPSRKADFPKLALTSDQFAMIEALDRVGFKKYSVYIHKVHHSHAAIIYRRDAKRYDEGKVVVRHWLDYFEV